MKYFYIAAGIVVLFPIIWRVLGWLYMVIRLSVSYKINPDIKYDSPRYKWVLNGLGTLLVKGWRYKYKVIGKEYVPTENVVLFGNHLDWVDPVILVYEFRHTSISGLAKKSLFTIPIFSIWLLKRRAIPMDRVSARKDAEAMIKAIRYAKEGQPMFVFPEGTRSKQGELLPFRPGAFRLATKSKQTIVVFKFTGTNEHKWYHLRRKTSTLEFFPAIPYEDYKDMTTQEISDMVRGIIEGSN